MDHQDYPAAVWQRARVIRLLILDVDGVLTDGRLYFGPQGEALKVFHVRDGHGIKMAQKGGLEIAMVSGRRSDAAYHRARELGVNRPKGTSESGKKPYLPINRKDHTAMVPSLRCRVLLAEPKGAKGGLVIVESSH